MSGALLLAAAVVLGIAAGALTDVRALDCAALLLSALSLALALPSGRIRAASLLVAVVLAGAAEGATARDRALAPPLGVWLRTTTGATRAREPVMVRGVLAADAAVTDTGVRLLVDVAAIGPPQQMQSVRGRIQLNVGGGFGADTAVTWTAGRPVETMAAVREPSWLRNPGGPTERWQRLHQLSDLTGTIKSAALVQVARGAWWDEAAAFLRRRVRESAAHTIAPHSRQSAAVATAILIGDRTGLGDEVQRRLRAAGTYHVIAISGGNVAMLTWLCFLLARMVLRSFRAVALVTMAVVVTYGWLVGSEPSVRRAIIAATLYLSLSFVGLKPRALDVLGLTALLVAAASPLTVLDPAAWLSFGATLGIILGAARFQEWATGTALQLPPRGHSAPLPIARRLWLVLVGLFGATFAAELALAPLSAALFARVSALGLVLNFIAIPAMTVVQLSALAASALDGWAGGIARAAGWVAHVSASWLVGTSAAADSAPWLVWRTPTCSPGWILSYYAALGLAMSLRGRSPWRRAAVVTAAVSLAGIMTAPGLAFEQPRGGRLRLTMLDVGQGDALVLQAPDGQALLVDTGGGIGPSDLGSRVGAPAMWALGIRRLDWLALSHPDLDHIGAASAVMHDFRPREIWEGIPVPLHPSMLDLRRQAHDERVAWRQVIAGHRLELGAVVIDVVHPSPPDWERRRVRNDDSLVCRVRFGDVEVLLTGDAGAEFEARFRPDPSPAALRVLKVAHHGSRSSSGWPFLGSFRPQVALISAGRGNAFGHPSPDVLSRYAQIDAVVFRTDQDGAITVETDGRMVEVRTMSGRHWVLTHVIQNSGFRIQN